MQERYTIEKVKSVGKVAVSLLALSFFASPVMACLLPSQALTDEERECCRQMAGNCDETPSSHSCCQAIIRDGGPYICNSHVVVSAPAQVALAILPLDKTIGLPENTSQFVALDAHAPPGSPPSHTSILRI
jgi:hypothetical protein